MSKPEKQADSQPPRPQPEPWLRGTMLEVPPVARAVLHALQLAGEDIHRWCGSLTQADMHARPLGLPSVAFHLRHIARSLDRLLTYTEGNSLSDSQMAALKTEMDPGTSRSRLFLEFDRGLATAAERVRALAGSDMEQQRGIGRKQLPASVGGLLVHLADHTLRHVGQAVTTAKVLAAQDRFLEQTGK